MPTYEYECQDCGHRFEMFQSMMEDPYNICPVCKGTVKRLISSGAGLIFKGSGFYITDYKKKETSVTGPVKNTSSKKSTGDASKGSESSKSKKDGSSSKSDSSK